MANLKIINIMQATKQINNLDKILSDLVVYIEPNRLKAEYRTRINIQNTNKASLKKYFKLLTSVSLAYKKIQKYELFFTEFYPETEKIKKYEALEHHIHAYLEDLDMFRNKIKTFLGALKNDLKKIAKNKEEIGEALTGLIEKVFKAFNDVSNHRDPHHHNEMPFIDGDLIDSKMIHNVTKDDSPSLYLFKPEFIDKLKKREVESFEKAKENWISLAKKNSAEISALVNEVFKINKASLYKFLNIKSVDDVITKTKK